jgi:hypothetical protein
MGPAYFVRSLRGFGPFAALIVGECYARIGVRRGSSARGVEARS